MANITAKVNRGFFNCWMLKVFHSMFKISAVNDSECPELPSYRFHLETAKNGEPVPVLEVGGQTCVIGSRYDPGKEAERFAASLGVSDRDLIILLGGGSRVAAAILKLDPQFSLAYLEPVPEMRADAPAQDSRFHYLKTPADLFSLIQTIGIEDISRFRFAVHPSLKRPFSGYLDWVSRKAQEVFEERISGMATLAGVGDLVVKNILSNLARFSRMAPVRNIISNPAPSVACVVGSGPSLDHSADEIARFRDRMWIIAADSAVLPLLARGVVPDIAVGLDPRMEEAEHMWQVPESARPSLSWAVSTGMHPAALRHLEQSPVFVFAGDHPLDIWLSEKFGDPGSLSAGGSVILPAFDLACRLGATEIILAGADFSYGRGLLSHSADSARMREILSATHRFGTVEALAYREAADRAPRQVEFNQTLYRTGENLLAYRRQLDILVSQYGGRCRQLMPALALRNAEGCESLRDLREKPIIYREEVLAARGSAGWASPQAVSAVQEELRNRLSREIDQDPLFRTAVEAAVFQRIRKTREKAVDVVREVSKGVAGELIRALDRRGEGA